jgi:hypothetical protein
MKAQDLFTQNQIDRVEAMLKAPAGDWVMTGTFKLKNFDTKKVAIRIESRKFKKWGFIVPNGEFVTPKNGRKTINHSDVAQYL